MKFIKDPAFSYGKFKVDLGIDLDAIENAKFYKEIIAFARFVA